MQPIRAVVVVLVVMSACRSYGVTVRDDRGQVRAVLGIDGLSLLDANGRERLVAQVGADGRSRLLLCDGAERMELTGNEQGWLLTVGEEGAEPRVVLSAPRLAEACLRVGATAVGGQSFDRGIVGVTVADEEGRERVAIGMVDGRAGLRVADTSGCKRAGLSVIDRDTPVSFGLSDEQGVQRVDLGAKTGWGGWLRVMAPSQDREAVVSSDALTLCTARGKFEVAVDDQGYPILRLAGDEAGTEVGIEGGEEPFIRLKNAKGEVQRIPAK